MRLVAAQATAGDFTPEQGTGTGPEDRSDGARTATVDFAADQGAKRTTDDQAGRAVVAAAIILAVLATIDAIVAGQTVVGIIAAVAIVTVGIIAIIARLVAVIIVAAVSLPVARILALGLTQFAAAFAQFRTIFGATVGPAKLAITFAHFLIVVAALGGRRGRDRDRRSHGKRGGGKDHAIHQVFLRICPKCIGPKG